MDVLIWHGDADLSVPYTQSLRIYEAFVEAEGEEHVDLVIFPNIKHAADKLYGEKSLSNIVEYLQKKQ